MTRSLAELTPRQGWVTRSTEAPNVRALPGETLYACLVSQSLARSIAAMGVRDARVLWAIGQIDRHLFVPPSLRLEADDDRPLPIGYGQTISQPYIVAFMTEALALAGKERVLEIGTGSGYQTAILSLLAGEVYSIEIIPQLSSRAAVLLLGTLALVNVHLRTGDGTQGWPEQAPFDRILVTAAPETLPEPLVHQLGPEGRMIVPVGEQYDVQMLKQVDRAASGELLVHDILPVRFVPLTGGEPMVH